MSWSVTFLGWTWNWTRQINELCSCASLIGTAGAQQLDLVQPASNCLASAAFGLQQRSYFVSWSYCNGTAHFGANKNHPGHPGFWIGCLRSCDGTELRTCKWLGSTWASALGTAQWDQIQMGSVTSDQHLAKVHSSTVAPPYWAFRASRNESRLWSEASAENDFDSDAE